MKIEIRRIESTDAVYQRMLTLREAILRSPLGLSFSQTDIDKEINDLFIAGFEKDENLLVGCCVLTPINDKTVRLRQMAVLESFQKKGIGTQLAVFAEKEAKKVPFAEMILHAREPIVPFYEKLGYQKEGELFEEVTLPHFKMKKAL